jgi:hypothetical protein
VQASCSQRRTQQARHRAQALTAACMSERLAMLPLSDRTPETRCDSAMALDAPRPLTLSACMSACRSRRPAGPPTPLVQRHGRRGSQATWSPTLPLPAAVPAAYGPCADSPASDLLWRLAAGTALWGFNSVSWGFNSAARPSGPVCQAVAVVRGTAGQQRELSPCFPDDQAQ